MLKAGELHVYIDESGEVRPADEETHKRIKRLKKGNYYSLKYKVIRNYKFHKKFFSLLNLAYQNQELFDNFEWFREYTLLGAGHFESAITPDGKTMYKTKSISFDKCSEDEFNEVYQNTLTFLMGKYGFTLEFIDKLLEYS
jgi:hypothetical protein